MSVPARARATLDREGTIQKGKRAELVLLDGNPLSDIRNVARVAAVVQGGKVLSRADLDALLVKARQ